MNCTPPRIQSTGTMLAVLVLLAGAALLAGCGGSGGEDESYTEKMAEQHDGDRPVEGAAAIEAEPTPIDSETVQYATVDGIPIDGYLVWPKDAPDDAPAIVVIHEWWGLNRNVRSMTAKLAAEGYVAVDLYRGQVGEVPAAARELMQAAMDRQPQVEDNLRQAVDYLKQRGSTRIGVIGWCFGGGWSLRTALLRPDDIDALVIYYGQLVTDPERLKTLDMPILGIFGGQDQGIPVDSVREFEATLQNLGKDADIHVYEDADHAFANPSGTRYMPEDAKDAWRRTLEFFAAHLKPTE